MGKRTSKERLDAVLERAINKIKERGGRDFDGDTYEPNIDRDRLLTQLGQVFCIMRDGKWRTLSQIRSQQETAFGTGGSEASISARLRDYRKPKFGGHTVERQRKGAAGFVYRLLVRQGPPPEEDAKQEEMAI